MGKETYKYVTQKDIISDVAHEFGISEDKVEFIVKDFFNNLRYYLTHPKEARKGIVLDNAFKFTINERLLRYHVYKELSKEDEDKINFALVDNLSDLMDQLFYLKKSVKEIEKDQKNEEE